MRSLVLTRSFSGSDRQYVKLIDTKLQSYRQFVMLSVTLVKRSRSVSLWDSASREILPYACGTHSRSVRMTYLNATWYDTSTAVGKRDYA
jgi:hypothetical protein